MRTQALSETFIGAISSSTSFFLPLQNNTFPKRNITKKNPSALRAGKSSRSQLDMLPYQVHLYSTTKLIKPMAQNE